MSDSFNSALRNTNTPWFAISMVLAGFVVGVGLTTAMSGSSGGTAKVANNPAPAAPAAPSAPAPTPTGEVTPVDPDVDHIRGDADATISIIEYSDFECPFCQRHHPTMKQVLDEVSDVNWVYRHYPLSFHPNAQPAAIASECAADQDMFWEFADIVFEKGSAPSAYAGYAAEIGLDTAEFANCLEDNDHLTKINDQMAKGTAAGVRGTPGNIVINNETEESQLVSGAQGVEAFKTAIEALR